MTLRRVLPSVGPFLFVLGLWLIGRPYDGIWHDSVLYTAQALRHLYPQIYDHDLFFRYGSQDSYTIFSAFYAQAIRLWGVQAAAEILTFAGKLCWFGALAYACSAFLRDKAFWLGLAIAATASPYYDSFRVFSYGESFVTNRLYAEALTLGALGLFLRGRVLVAAAVLAVTLAVHPLIALPGIGLLLAIAFVKGPPRARWSLGLSLLLGVALLLALAALHVAPFGRLFQAYDKAWFSIIRVRDIDVFLGNWDAGAFARVALLGGLLGWLGCGGDEPLRSLARGALLTLGVFMLVAWAGADGLHDVLLTQLQLWRVLWLVQLLAMALLGGALMRALRGTPDDRWVVTLLCCALALNDVASAIPAIVVAAAYALSLWRPLYWLRPRLAFVLALLALAAYGALVWLFMHLWSNVARPIWLPALANLVVACGGVAGLLALRAGGPRPAAAAASLGALVCALGLWAFADRGTAQKAPDPQLAAALRPYIPEDATVYKVGGLRFDWLELRRAHYADRQQGAGLLFSRAATMEAERRYERLRQVGLEEDASLHMPWDPESKRQRLAASRPPEDAALAYLCDDPVLDYVILTDPVDPLTPVTASYIYQGRPGRDRGLVRLYACSQVRLQVHGGSHAPAR